MPDAQTHLLLTHCSVDLRRKRIIRPDGEVGLTSREAALLAYLSARPGQVVSRDELLQEVWGYAPGVVSRAVDKTMARLRAKVEGTPSKPVHLISAQAVGYRFEPRNPARSTGQLVGRSGELAQARALLDQAAVLVIGGPGGIGKTLFARTLAQEFPRSWFCALGEITDAEGLLATVQTALGLPPAASVERALATMDGLLVLDNAEHIREEVTAVVSRWFQGAQARILITSREKLEISGSQWFRLKPLGGEDAVALFIRRAQRVDPGLVFDDADRPALRSVIQYLDGLPLAVELAAARMDVCSLEELAERLQGYAGLDLLAGGKGRHATLRRTIEDSWTLLDSAQQRALAQCTVFRGGFTLAAAEAVLEPGGETPVLDLVRGLQIRSLLTVTRPEGPRGPARFGLHRAVRLFAAERREDDGLEARHAAYMIDRGRALVAAIHRPGGPRALSRLVRERDNLLAAMTVSGAVVELAAVLQPVFKTRGPMASWRAVCEQAVAAAADPAERGRALAHRGYVALVTGALESATADFEQALALAQQADDDEGAALVAVRLAFLHDLAGRQLAARALLEGALPAEGRIRAVVLGDLGIHHFRGGRWEEAEGYYRHSLALLDQLGDEIQRPLTCLNRAHNLRILSRKTEAIEMLREAVLLSQRAGLHRTEGVARLGLADLEPDRFAEHIDQAHGLGDRIGSVELATVARARMATERHRLGDLDAARAGYLSAQRGLAAVRTQAPEGSWLLDLLVALVRQEQRDDHGALAALSAMVRPEDPALRARVDAAASAVEQFWTLRSASRLRAAVEEPFASAPDLQRFVRVLEAGLRRR